MTVLSASHIAKPLAARATRPSLGALQLRLASSVPTDNIHDDDTVLAHLPAARAFQQQVPGALPVPALEDTLDRYVSMIQPFSSPDTVQHAKKVAEQMKSDPVLQQCQQYLLKRAKTHKNWLADWWLNKAYLEYRESVVINVSPAALIQMVHFKTQDDWLKFAAQIVLGTYRAKLNTESAEFVESQRKAGQCISQYYKLFNLCRQPAMPKDKMVVYPTAGPNAPRHIVVISNQQFYAVDLVDENRNPVEPDELYKQLAWIYAQTSQRAEPSPVGLLTSLPRDKWAAAYNALREDANNSTVLDTIESCMFVLCLDQCKPEEETTTRCGPHSSPESLCANLLLHGGGSAVHTGNRWFDKTHQVIVGGSGHFGMLQEHSTAEGVIPTRLLCDAVINAAKATKKNIAVGELESLQPENQPIRLQFTLNRPEIPDNINEASQLIDKSISNLDLQALMFEDFGKQFIKTCNISPDAFVQVAMQLAVFRYFLDPSEDVECQLLVPTYESGSLRAFQYGRTETIRSATSQALRFCRAVCAHPQSPASLPSLLRDATSAHIALTKAAMQMKGVDRHLLGLQAAFHLLNKDGGNLPKPALFTEQFVQYASAIQLSTSQVPVSFPGFMCFGPTHADGFGVCYNIQPNFINFGVSSLRDSPKADTATFMAEIRNALLTMRRILDNHPKAKL